ncbi:substance-K receptor [Caerostris extrusa]|uniref:Substance-K receptor n=1 Tax=Caerostris extrusa TaxID=172846 RepID=A0AAV4SGI9_CAEEX|nr:substance-K receptor [Caerostris extrusa]
MSRWITLIAVITQYVLPLTITGVLYYLIIVQVWSRDAVGVVTENQRISQARAKKKTIKMLVLVVILFAICWLPLNTFNIMREFNVTILMQKSVTHSTVFFICHWLAMSSVCYNPFIYCWLNDNFRSGALRCLLCVKNASCHINESLLSTKASRPSSNAPTMQSVDCGQDSNLDSAINNASRNAIQRSNMMPYTDQSRCRQKSHEFDIPLRYLPTKNSQSIVEEK